MTVQEFIDKLHEFDPALSIVVYDPEEREFIDPDVYVSEGPTHDLDVVVII